MNPIHAFLKLIRLPNLLIIVITQYAIRYGIIAPILNSISDHVEIKLQLSEWNFFLLTLSTVMIAAAGYIINDYFDLKIDRVNRPTHIIVGKYIKRRVAMGGHIVINSLAIIIAAYLAYKMGNIKLVAIQILSAGALWYYSIAFKKQVLIGNIVIAVLAALVPFVVGLYEVLLQQAVSETVVNQMLFHLDVETPFNDAMYAFQAMLSNIMLWVIGFSLFAFLSTMVREIIKDIEDYEGDKKYFAHTLPVMYGKKKGKMVAQFIACIMLILIAYLQYKQVMSKDIVSAMYFLFAIQFPLIYVIYQLQLADDKADYTKLSKYMKLIMLSGIVYTALFYYSLTHL